MRGKPDKADISCNIYIWLCIAVHPRILDRYWTRGGNMPRKVRDSALETRTARSRLAVRHKPYFRLIEPGLHLGYRKLTSGPGTWLARRYVSNGRYVVE